MKLSELPRAALNARLGGVGLFLRTGPFLYHITSQIDSVADGLGALYGDFSIADVAEFADYHVRLLRRRNWRRMGWNVDVQVGAATPSDPLPVEQSFAVFEGCLNWCVYTHANQYLIVHAAAVEKEGGTAILPAPPGSGKSTLCAALVNSGWRLLTDELTLIQTDTGAIVPLARPISLKNESIEVIRRFAPQAEFGPVSPNTIKGTVAHMRPPAESVARANECSQVRWLVKPRYSASSALSAKPISKGRGFMLMAASAVNYMMHGADGFRLLTGMIDGMDAFELEYSGLTEAIQWFDGLMESPD